MSENVCFHLLFTFQGKLNCCNPFKLFQTKGESVLKACQETELKKKKEKEKLCVNTS